MDILMNKQFYINTLTFWVFLLIFGWVVNNGWQIVKGVPIAQTFENYKFNYFTIPVVLAYSYFNLMRVRKK